MRRKIAGLTALLVVCTALSTGESEGGSRRRERRACRDACCPIPICRGNKVCPIYPYAMHGTYWSYYALVDCDPNQPVSLDAPPNTPTCPCPDTTNCLGTLGDMYRFGLGSHKGGCHEKLSKGIAKSNKPTNAVDDDQLTATKTPIAQVWFWDKSANPQMHYAQLMQFDVECKIPNAVGKATFYIGEEIDNPGGNPTQLQPGTDSHAHCYYLTYPADSTGKEYHVMLWK